MCQRIAEKWYAYRRMDEWSTKKESIEMAFIYAIINMYIINILEAV